LSDLLVSLDIQYPPERSLSILMNSSDSGDFRYGDTAAYIYDYEISEGGHAEASLALIGRPRMTNERRIGVWCGKPISYVQVILTLA
jgi:hypothetical protein